MVEKNGNKAEVVTKYFDYNVVAETCRWRLVNTFWNVIVCPASFQNVGKHSLHSWRMRNIFTF